MSTENDKILYCCISNLEWRQIITQGIYMAEATTPEKTINKPAAAGSTPRPVKLVIPALTALAVAMLLASLLRRAESSLTGSAKNARRK